MKKKLFVLALSCFSFVAGFAQQRCADAAMLQHMEALYPGTIAQMELERANISAKIAEYKEVQRSGKLFKTTSTAVTIPVVFHFVLDTNEYVSIGGTAGIEDRITSQLKVLNDDFNGNNADKTSVPSVWAPLFANVGISFALAHIAPGGSSSPGYDVRIVANGTSFAAEDGAKSAKFNASGGTDCWDNTRYFNVWVVNLKVSGSTALGVTAPPTIPAFTKPEYGIAVNYQSFGSRTSATELFINHFDKGRTLTHEMGHYFNLIHTWGDDGGLCPGSGGKDDGISDTPPEASQTTGAPAFPHYDACSPASTNGVMFMNYMDYSDDVALFMFTQEQSLVMNIQVSPGGPSYPLTLNPGLIDTQYKPAAQIVIGPNPTTGILYLKYDNIGNPLDRIIVYNTIGQKVIETSEQNINSIDMSFLSKGVYFVHFYFKNEIVKQKIRLQ